MGYIRCSRRALLLEGEQHAVVAVDLGVQLISVVRDHHIGHVLQIDRPNIPRFHGEQHLALHFLHVAILVAHLNGVLLLPLGKVAGRHREVLRRQDIADHVGGYNA